MHGSQQKNLIFLIVNLFCLENVIESLPVEQNYHRNDSPVVYRRYVRKRPSYYEGDIYMEEVREIFETRRRPPEFSVFNDVEIDQLIRCDFEPHLRECENLRNLEPNFSTTTTSNTAAATTSRPPLKFQPIPTKSTSKPNVPTPAVDMNPPRTDEIDGIPTLPPDSAEYAENPNDPLDYEEEGTDNYSEVIENDDQNNEENEVDEEDGDDF